jgi:hypothetical protein
MLISTTTLTRKYPKVTLVSDFHIRISPLHLCTEQGHQCLGLFIKTRVMQPEICRNCLRDMNLLWKFDIIKPYDSKS